MKKPKPQDESSKLSKKELAARREEITAFYKDNIPHLEVQADYETLLSAIEKARAERMQAQVYMAQQYATQNQEEDKIKPVSPEAKDFQEAMSKAMGNETA
tara:strand:- start:1460 stop:1762 length:303 start_codon:yes stop_codon:yes gene_type:complete